ncbi:hypothetical protein [Streptomyces sp. SP18BB07]|uniref:hypothetical protein n=1 Tax=Streptomyces sp. SP18BB07 TaxID=3002522 RepID=UPI002E7A6ABB|nr:hypothetical protein [Streptomyces sp. SP18BB07]MEE1765326.1 hypothetical protein [Streptomyces sp. SP18BB07]
MIFVQIEKPLRLVTLLALIAALWGVRRAWIRWARPVVRAQLRIFSTDTERRISTAMREALEGIVTRGPETRGLVAASVWRWARAMPTTMLWRLAVVLMVFLLINLRPPVLHDPTTWVAALHEGWDAIKSLPGKAVAVVKQPSRFLPLRFLFFCLMFGLALWVCWPAHLARTGGQAQLTGSPRQTRRREAAEAAALNWPVVALAVSAIQCGRAYHELQQQSQAPTGVAERQPVSVKRAENVIKQAWRTRYPASSLNRVRRHERKALKQHAEKVIAALRSVESRQYKDPSGALPELATMLLVIAERYAQGRVSQLLDDEQLENVQVVRDWGWLRLLFGGALITVALVGVAQIGLPDTAVGPVAALLITLVLTMVHRGRLPGLADLIDIMRSADRR